MTATLEFRILGPLEVWVDGRQISIAPLKERALLAALLLHANEVVPTDRLIDDLWGETPPGRGTHALHVYVSNLRKAFESAGASRDVLRTRAPGYAVDVAPGHLDLHLFERLFQEGGDALAGGETDLAAAKLREALGLWRGPALADFTYEAFAQAGIARLEELRLAALEERIEADLALGRHASLIGELEALVARHPLRERLRGQLMVALYRSGRQAEALAAYQETRRVLVDELGIEPTPALQELEKDILLQRVAPAEASKRLSADRTSRDLVEAPLSLPERSILIVAQNELALDPLLALAEPLGAWLRPHELILALLVPPAAPRSSAGREQDPLARASAELETRRTAITRRGVSARIAAFTSLGAGTDMVRMSSEQNVDLLLVDEDRGLLARGELGRELALPLAEAPCDLAVWVSASKTPEGPSAEKVVAVPFGGAEHDWAALELGAWLAAAHGAPLRLVGTAADPDAERRDASRLLASASLAVQQLVGVPAEPKLVTPGADGIVEGTADAGVLVIGLSEDWRAEGIGAARAEIVREAAPQVLLVRRGVRPGGLAPRTSLTRFTWSLSGTEPG